MRLMIVIALTLAACSDGPTRPDVDCSSMIGHVSIELQPPPTGTSYQVAVGDSIRVTGSLHRVTGAAPTFGQFQGWTCSVTATTPIAGSVSFHTEHTDLISLRPNGWIRGLGRGLAVLTASSDATDAEVTVGVLVL